MLSDLVQEVLSDAKNEASDKGESDSNDSDNDVDTYDTNFYEWKTEYAKKNKKKRQFKEENMKLLHLSMA